MTKFRDEATKRVFFSATRYVLLLPTLLGVQIIMHYPAKYCFSIKRDGDGIKIQRQIFSEVFYVMAMAGLARATKESKYRVRE